MSTFWNAFFIWQSNNTAIILINFCQFCKLHATLPTATPAFSQSGVQTGKGLKLLHIIRNPQGLKRVTAPCVLGNKLLNIQFAKYHIWNNKSKGFPNMVLSTETFNQSVRTEYSEAVNTRYTFQPLWVSDIINKTLFVTLFGKTGLNEICVRMHFNAFWMHYNAFQRSPMIRNALTTFPIDRWQFCLMFHNDFPTFFNALATFPSF